MKDKKKKKDNFPEPIWSMNFTRDKQCSNLSFGNDLCLGFSIFRQKKGEPEKLTVSMLRFFGKHRDAMFSTVDLNSEEVISLTDALLLIRNRFTK